MEYVHNPSGTTLEPYYNELRDRGEILDYPQAFVDIITPHAGGRANMAEKVYNALLKHGNGVNWRWIVVSQGEFGSHDFLIKAAAHDERVIPILNEWNKPVPHAYNQAYLMSMRMKNPSPFIFTLDDDTLIIRDDWLDYLLDIRRAYPNKDKIGITSYGSAAIGRKTIGYTYDDSHNDIGWAENLTHRDVFDTVGLADEHYCWHFCDSCICRRTTLHNGYKIVLGVHPNKWRIHIGRVGSRQLGFVEEWWRAMSIEVGNQKWANTPVKGVGSELVLDKVRSTSYTYPKEGWWAPSVDFMTFNHGLSLDKSQAFPFFIKGHEDVSCLDKTKDVNLRSYRNYLLSNPSLKERFDAVVKQYYDVSGSVDSFLSDIPVGIWSLYEDDREL